MSNELLKAKIVGKTRLSGMIKELMVGMFGSERKAASRFLKITSATKARYAGTIIKPKKLKQVHKAIILGTFKIFYCYYYYL